MLFPLLCCTPEENPLDRRPDDIDNKDKQEEQEEQEHATPGANSLFGYVKDNSGNPVAGAVVSDGFTCSTTEKDGYYCFTSTVPDRVKFVHVSIPDGYRPVIKDGVPVFYSKVTQASTGGARKVADIVLQKSSPLNAYYFVFTGDPQSRNINKTATVAKYEKIAFTSESVYRDHLADIGETASKLGIPCFGMALGDICANDPTQYPIYTECLKSTGIPFFSVIGNHDHQYTGKKSDDECAAEFEEVFGPRNYSFNLGNVHFIALDNLIFEPDPATGVMGSITDFTEGFEDPFMDWLEKDLSYVAKTTKLMICFHAPVSSPDKFTSSFRNIDRFKSLVSAYSQVYIWSGHVHRMDNKATRKSADLPNVEEHTVNRACGMLNLNEYCCDDGTPRGYVLMRVAGNMVTWQFKPSVIQTGTCGTPGYDYPYRDYDFVNGRAVMRDGSGELNDSYQLKAYSRGDYDDDYVYASIFMWDSKWGQPVLKAGGKEYPMKQTNFHDHGYTSMLVWYKNQNSFYDGATADWSHAKQRHHFSVKVPDGVTGTGTVSVKDRFGNTWSRPVSLDPIKYDDGKLHLVFDFTTCPSGWNTSSKTNMTLPYTIDGATYNFVSSKGYYNSTYYALQGSDASLALPAISGKKLSGVTIRICSATKERDIKILDPAGNQAEGGREIHLWGEESFHWDIKYPREGSYRIFSSIGLPIESIRLTYE